MCLRAGSNPARSAKFFVYHIIYKIINKVNRKTYIGAHSTSNLDDGYMGSGKALKRAFSFYNPENFTKEVLFVFDDIESMFEKEAELVTEDVVKDPNTYNLTVGGKQGLAYYGSQFSNNKGNHRKTGNWGWKVRPAITEEFKKKLSEGVKRSLSERGNHWVGRKHTDDAKAVISEKAKIHQAGSRNSQYGTCWVNRDGVERKIKLECIPEYSDWSRGRIKRVGQS